MGRSGGRPLHETPDHFVKAKLTHCEACGDVIPKRLQQLLQRCKSNEVNDNNTPFNQFIMFSIVLKL